MIDDRLARSVQEASGALSTAELEVMQTLQAMAVGSGYGFHGIPKTFRSSQLDVNHWRSRTSPNWAEDASAKSSRHLGLLAFFEDFHVKTFLTAPFSLQDSPDSHI